MLSMLTGWFAKKWASALPYLLGAVAALGLLWGVVRMLLGAGRAQERADVATTIIKNTKDRHEVDARVAREPAPGERLHQRWSRD